MIEKFSILIFSLYSLGCNHSNSIDSIPESRKNTIKCTDKQCSGTYVGVEFINTSDVAHQFSNRMSEKVGDKLKELYKNGTYAKVDFSRITMSTEGMGSGKVIYKLTIPFKNVKEKCQAATSFDHAGGWNHAPELSIRKTQLKSALLHGENLDISELMKTPEGLQEYWIQWKNKEVQAHCGNTKP